MEIEKLKKEYETQDNRGTAYPIFVTAQELVCIGVIADGYSPNCPYGDGESKVVFTHPELEGEFETIKEINEALLEYYEGNQEAANISRIYTEEKILGYIWIDREFFLTLKGAKEYLKSNAHNMGKTRTYVHYMDRRNFEMREFLKELGFKVK